MVRRAAALLLLAAFLAGCGSGNQARSTTPFVPKPGDIELPKLPAQGLAVNRQKGVELMGLDGKRYGFLTGFTAVYSGFTSFWPIDPSRSRLSGKGENYFLDPTDGYLIRTTPKRIDLGYGFEYRRISVWKATEADEKVASLGDSNDEGEMRDEIYRDGKPYLYLGAVNNAMALTREGDFLSVGSLTVAGSNLLVKVKSRLIDLKTGSMGPLPPGCTVYGLRKGVLNALCTYTGPKGLATLSLRRKDGKRWPIVHAWKKVDGEWKGGVLSPDQRHLVVSRGIPCDSELVEIVDAQGPDRKVLGEGTALGWSASGKAIVYLKEKANPGCDTREPYSGAVYSVDPDTLKRTLIVRTSAAKFWSKTPAA